MLLLSTLGKKPRFVAQLRSSKVHELIIRAVIIFSSLSSCRSALTHWFSSYRVNFFSSSRICWLEFAYATWSEMVPVAWGRDHGYRYPLYKWPSSSNARFFCHSYSWSLGGSSFIFVSTFLLPKLFRFFHVRPYSFSINMVRSLDVPTAGRSLTGRGEGESSDSHDPSRAKSPQYMEELRPESIRSTIIEYRIASL